MKGSRLVLINVLVLLALVIIAAVVGYYYTQGVNYVSTDDAAISAPSVPVLAVEPGVVTSLSVHVGQHVSKGQVVGTEQVAGGTTTIPTKKGTRVVPVANTVNIVAPVSGQVAVVSAVKGQTVGAGSPLFTEVELSQVYVTANVLETDIAKVHLGQTVSITVDAQPGVTFTGHVRAIQPATQSFFSLIPTTATAGTYTKVVQRVPVIISIETAGYTLLPGESAEVQIHLTGNS
jgi:multidrug resistance efflux pump